MSTHRVVLAVVLIFALLAPGTSLAQPAASPAADTPSASNGSMLIIENAGQWPDAARFQVWNSPLGAGTTWLAEDAIWLVMDRGSEDQKSAWHSDLTADLRPQTSALRALKLTFPGSNPDVRIEPFDPLTTTVSYFIGDDPERWQPDVPVYGGVRYIDLYPGVDLVMGGRDRGWQLEATPGTAVDRVRVRVEGAGILALDGATLELAGADELLSITLPTAPFTYQVSGMSRQGDPLTLMVPSGPHRTQWKHPDDDPSDLLYSTFLGGTGPLADSGSAIAVDEAGSAYVTGQTGSTDFPATPGVFDPSFNGGFYDAFVVKLNPTGSDLVYATFLGGSGFYEAGEAITMDVAGNAYVTGTTDSANFPTTPGAFDTTFNGGEIDAFVAKLNPTGSALVYATYLGGSAGDYGYAIAVDGANSAYLLGETFSSDFPTTPGTFDPTHNGSLDTFVAKLNPAGSALAYATFLGGSSGDAGRGIAVDTALNAYATGRTSSSNFPSTPGAFDPSFNGGPYGAGDAFAVKLNPAGSALAYGTFLGGSDGNDDGGGIALDTLGNAYVAGGTTSSDFPVTPGAFDPSFNGMRDAFLAKLNPAGSGLVYATFLGGAGIDGGNGIAADGTGNAYVSGGTTSSDFPTTPSAFDASYNGGDDVFVARLNPAGDELAYATYLGGSGSEGGDLAFDGASGAYLAGSTTSNDFPATPGAFDPSYNDGESDAFVAKLRIGPYSSNVLAPIELPGSGAFVNGAVTLRGFAIDRGSVTGTGIDRTSIYLDGPFGTGTLIGDPTYGINRPDIAAQYGARFGPSGWELPWNTTGLATGVHRLYLYAHRTTDNAWSVMGPHVVIVPGGPTSWLPIVLRRQ